MAPQIYPSDLTDAEWELLAPLIPPAKPGGRPRSVDLRRIREWRLLCPAQRLRLALSAARVRSLADRLLLLSSVAPRWDLGAHPRAPTRTRAPACRT